MEEINEGTKPSAAYQIQFFHNFLVDFRHSIKMDNFVNRFGKLLFNTVMLLSMSLGSSGTKASSESCPEFSFGGLTLGESFDESSELFWKYELKKSKYYKTYRSRNHPSGFEFVVRVSAIDDHKVISFIANRTLFFQGTTYALKEEVTNYNYSEDFKEKHGQPTKSIYKEYLDNSALSKVFENKKLRYGTFDDYGITINGFSFTDIVTGDRHAGTDRFSFVRTLQIDAECSLLEDAISIKRGAVREENTNGSKEKPVVF